MKFEHLAKISIPKLLQPSAKSDFFSGNEAFWAGHINYDSFKKMPRIIECTGTGNRTTFSNVAIESNNRGAAPKLNIKWLMTLASAMTHLEGWIGEEAVIVHIESP